MGCQNYNMIYTTGRVVKIPSTFLAITHKIISVVVLLYILIYVMWVSKSYQSTSSIESTVVSKVKGVFQTKFTDKELGVTTPDFYRRVWDASDLVINAHVDDSGGFVLLTNIIITPNQTRGTCPESEQAEKAVCKTEKDCPRDKVLHLGNGPLTGKCVIKSSPNVKTCEVSSWCPVETTDIPLKGTRALLAETKDFTVLVKNSVEFPMFGDSYKRRNVMDGATREYLQSCVHNPSTNPYCPTFRIGDIVQRAGYDYNTVALTGGVFSIKIKWFCSFDFGASIRDCRPQYGFARLDNPNAYVSPGFSFRTAVFHEENRRTLTRNVGLKIIIQVEGEGRKFDSVRLVLAIGAGMGLFAIASKICDMLLKFCFKLKRRFKWQCLEAYHYNEDMKYDLSYVRKANNDISSTLENSTELRRLPV